MKYLQEIEQQKLIGYWNQMKKVGGRRNLQRWLLVNTALNTGLRASELCDIKPGDIDFDDPPSITASTKKNGKGNLVVISKKLAEDLKWYLNNHHKCDLYLFSTERGKKQTTVGLYLIWQTALRMAGVKKYPLHATRHSFGYNLYKVSKDIRLTQKQLRHSSITSTMIYTDVSIESIAEMVNKIS